MENSIELSIPIVPKAQKRARHRIVKTKDGRIFGTTYKDTGERTEEQKFMALLYEHKPDVLITGPIYLGVMAYLPIPKSKSKKWQLAALMGDIRPTSKPDLDNLIKFLKDCMTGIFWKDDAQIVEYLDGTGKYYSANPRWEITILY